MAKDAQKSADYNLIPEFESFFRQCDGQIELAREWAKDGFEGKNNYPSPIGRSPFSLSMRYGIEGVQIPADDKDADYDGKEVEERGTPFFSDVDAQKWEEKELAERDEEEANPFCYTK